MTPFKNYVLLAILCLCIGLFIAYVLQLQYAEGLVAGLVLAEENYVKEAEGYYADGYLQCNAELVNLAFSRDAFSIYDSKNGNARKDFISIEACQSSCKEWVDTVGN